MDIPLRLLIIEDSERDVALEVRALEAAGYRVTYEVADNAAEMKAALIKQVFDIVISDHSLPQFDAPGALAVLKQSGLDIPFIIVSGAISEETAVALMKAGAHDYVMKDKLSRLVPAIQRELRDAESRRERNRAEEKLRESEERFRRISSIISDIAYSCRTKEDGRFSIDWMIGATERISGYSIEEIKAQSCWRFLVVEEDLALFEKKVIGLAPGSHGLCELRIRHKNGGIVWITSYTECFMATETPEHFLLYGALVDITEHKRAEEALKESANKYRLLADNMRDVVFFMDMNLNYTYISPSVKLLRGYEPEEAMKHTPAETVDALLHGLGPKDPI